MASAIDETKPIEGSPTTASVRANFLAAKNEIEALQTSPNFVNAATVTSTDAGAGAGPTLTLYRNSASPAAADLIGQLDFLGQDSGATSAVYARIAAQITDPTNLSEDGALFLQTMQNGTLSTVLTLTSAGQATFAGAIVGSGGMNIDSNTLVVDSTNNRVGVNQAAPLEALHVSGNIRGSSGVSTYLLQDNSPGSEGSPAYSFVNDPDTGIYSPFGGALGIATNGVPRAVFDDSGNLAVDTNTLFVDAVNNRVGIGTATPIQTFDVRSATPSMQVLETGSGESNRIVLGADTNGAYLNSTFGSGGAGVLRFETINAERMRITSSGAVGIGTSTPSEWLDVKSPNASTYLRLQTATNGLVYVGNNAGRLDLITNGATPAASITSSGNVGIGTSSPATPLFIGVSAANSYCVMDDGSNARLTFIGRATSSDIYSTTTSFGAYEDLVFRADNYTFNTSTTPVMTIANTGNVGIGTSSPSSPLHINSSSPSLRFQDSTDASYSDIIYDGGNYAFRADQGNTGAGTAMFFSVDGTERMRIDSSGSLLINYTGVTSSNEKLGVYQTSASSWTSYFENATTSPFGIEIFYSGTSVTGTGNTFIRCRNLVGDRFSVRSNGGVYNYQANDLNLSDRRAKKDIVDAFPYLERLCQIPVRNFRYKHDEDNEKHHLGVIAQEVEAVCPELVNKESWEYEGKLVDAVFNTDLMFSMLKAIQELTQRVQQLEAAQ